MQHAGDCRWVDEPMQDSPPMPNHQANHAHRRCRCKRNQQGKCDKADGKKGTFHNFQACRPRRLRHGDEWRQMGGVSDGRNPIENKIDAYVKRSVEEREEPHHSPEPDRAFDRGWAEVHIPLRRAELLVSGELLNRSHWRPSHRQVRTEGVAKYMYADVAKIRPSRSSEHEALHSALRQRAAGGGAEHPRSLQMAKCAQPARQSRRQRDVPQYSALGYRHVALPLGPLNAQLSFVQVDVGPLERHHLAAPQIPSPPDSTMT